MEGGGRAWRLTRTMKKIIVHQKVVAASALTGHDPKAPLPAIKLGVDIHQARYVVAAQEGHLTPRPARGFAPAEFVPSSRMSLA